MAASNQPESAKTATGGTVVSGVAPTPVLGDVYTEGAVTDKGTVTSHPGAPILNRAAPPTAPAAPEPTFLVRNMLAQPLHHPSGTVPKHGTADVNGKRLDTFRATAKELLAYGKQVEAVV